MKESPLATTGVGFNGGKFALTATNTTGALTQAPSSRHETQQWGRGITGYVADPDGAGPATSTADPITFTFPGVTYSGATTAGANGQSVVVSLSSNPQASQRPVAQRAALQLQPRLGPHPMGMGPAGTVATQPTAPARRLVLLTRRWVRPPWPTRAPHLFTNTAKPKVKGKLLVGKSLKCKPGTWSPAPTTTAFTWLRDGKAIRKATAAKYKIVKKDVGHKLGCSVTVSTPGYTPATATSKKTKKVPTP